MKKKASLCDFASRKKAMAAGRKLLVKNGMSSLWKVRVLKGLDQPDKWGIFDFKNKNLYLAPGVDGSFFEASMQNSFYEITATGDTMRLALKEFLRQLRPIHKAEATAKQALA